MTALKQKSKDIEDAIKFIRINLTDKLKDIDSHSKQWDIVKTRESVRLTIEASEKYNIDLNVIRKIGGFDYL